MLADEIADSRRFFEKHRPEPKERPKTLLQHFLLNSKKRPIMADGPRLGNLFNEAKSNPNLVLEENFRLADMWEMPLFKFQRIVTQAENKRRKAILWTSIPQGRPRTGPTCRMPSLSIT